MRASIGFEANDPSEGRSVGPPTSRTLLFTLDVDRTTDYRARSERTEIPVREPVTMSRNDRSDPDPNAGSVLVVTVATADQSRYDDSDSIPARKPIGADSGQEVLAFPDLERLTRTFTRKTLELIDAVRRERPASITETARIVDRDVKNVHTELRRLDELGVISFVEEGRSSRPVVQFDELRLCIRFDDERSHVPPELAHAPYRFEAPEEVYSRITDAFLALDRAARVTYANERAEELLDRSGEELIGSVIWEQFPGALGTAFEERYREAVRTQEPVAYETYFPPLDTWFAVRAYPSETGLTAYFRDVTDRKRRERQLERQRDELAAVNHLNRVIREITHRVVETTSRERMEREVCERLVEADSYAFAWTGDVERDGRTVTPNYTAGGEESYLGAVRIVVDSTDPYGQGPTSEAIRTHEPQFVQDLRTDPDYGPWRTQATKRGFRASAAVPFAYDGRLYGVLNLYSTRPDAFTKPVREALGHLGTVIGHAMYAIGQRKAIVSDSVLVLELYTETLASRLVGEDLDAHVSVKRTVPTGDGRIFQFVAVTGMAAEEFVDRVTQIPATEEAVLLDERDESEELWFRLTVSEPSLSETLASYGGRARSIRTTSDGTHIVAELPPDVHVREVLEEVNEIYPGTELIAQRIREREQRTIREIYGTLLDRLTEKQRAALETAYFAGYFDWPRTATGEEVADLLGIAAPTLANHLRAAERKLLGVLFEDDRVDRR